MFKSAKLGAILIALAAGIGAPSWSAADGAKGLFYEQLDKPAEHMNTGVQYWIELHRGNKVSRVNNKTAFRSGDKIRFHVKSNVDAFAYILLKEGSGGEQAVLFPDAAHNDETKVVHGRDYSLPQEGFLTFDNNPGTERLLLLLSRTPVDAQAYLDNNSNDRAQIAALPDGSKDLIPAKIVLAYEPPKEAFKPKVSTVSDTTPAVSDSSKPDARTKPAVTKTQTKPGKQPALVVATTTKTNKRPTHVASSKPSATSVEAASEPAASSSPTYGSGVVTVVNRDPSSVLALDLSLEHTQ
jgi:hypothetical protein